MARDIRGIGFKTADQLAQKLGIPKDSMLRARYAYGHIDGLARDTPLDFTDIERVRGEWFGSSSPFGGLVHLGVNLRGIGQAAEAARNFAARGLHHAAA